MSELDEFLDDILPRQKTAEKAIHNGDAAPRIEMWSREDPVTVLGALGMVRDGWQEVEETFHWIASRFSNCKEYDFELVAAGVSGDLAYTVGYERSTYSFDGGALEPRRLRATRVSTRAWRMEDRSPSRRPPFGRLSSQS